MSDEAPKVAVLVPRMHTTRCTTLEALFAILNSAEPPERLGLVALHASDKLLGDLLYGLRQAMLCRHQVR